MTIGRVFGPVTIQVRSGGQQMKLFCCDVEGWIASKAGDRMDVPRSEDDRKLPPVTAIRAPGRA